MQGIRILEMPDCKMVSSGTGMFGDERFNEFDAFISSQRRGLFPKDFLYWAGDGFVWLYAYEDGMTVPPQFPVVDFKGGLYAVATDIDQSTDRDALDAQVDDFLARSGFVRDDSRPQLGNIITSALAQRTLGYEQMDYYFPIKPKA